MFALVVSYVRCTFVCAQTVKRQTTDDKKTVGHCNRLTVSADMLNRVRYCRHFYQL